MKSDRYDIGGNEIIIVKCINCFHEVDITQLRGIDVNGMRHCNGFGLIVPDAFAECCDQPSYAHLSYF